MTIDKKQRRTKT